MDIVCAKCGMHFSSIEGAREHRGHCRATSKNEPVHWLPSDKTKLSKSDWDSLMKLINYNISASTTGQSKVPQAPDNLSINEASNSDKQALEATTKAPVIRESKQESISRVNGMAAENTHQKNVSKRQKQNRIHDSSQSNQKKDYLTQPWFLALLLLFTVSIVGMVISLILGNPSPLIIMFGISIIFSIEHWFYYKTVRRNLTCRTYKIFLNVFFIYLLATTFLSGVKLFSQQLLQNPLAGSILFFVEIGIIILIYRVLRNHRKRWPSMKLTFFSIAAITLILSFAGVEPLLTYKNESWNWLSNNIRVLADSSTGFINKTMETSANEINGALTANPTATAVTNPTNITQPGTSTLTSPTIKLPFLTAAPAALMAIIPGETTIIDRNAFQAIDQYALGTPESAAKSIDSLAAHLVRPAKNDFEKTRAIYRWITQNISYDFSAYLTNNYGSTKATDVLTSRSSVCEGYSGLFNALAKSAGLEVVTISGWAKGYGYNAGDQITGPINHAWNAVNINGGWYLIDSTWGAGSIVQQRFVREFDETYFLTPPEQFIYNHLPEDSKWQLLSTSFSKADYSALPYVHSNFFIHGLKLGNNTQSIINTQGSLSLMFPVSNDTYLMARVSQGAVELAETFTSAYRSGNQYQINATFPNPGHYILSIYASSGSEFGMYDGVLEYKVVVVANP